MSRIAAAVGGALVAAAVSTLGDFVWANWIPGHRPAYGLAHGTLLFFVIGLYLGMLARKPAVGRLRAVQNGGASAGLAVARSHGRRAMAGGSAGALLGFLAAGSFYVLAPLAGRPRVPIVMLLIWVAAWAGLGLLNGRVLQKRGNFREVMSRSVLAAAGSGIAFYAVSGIWFPFDPQGWDYAIHFVSWTVAYLPGFAALLWTERNPPALRTNDRPRDR